MTHAPASHAEDPYALAPWAGLLSIAALAPSSDAHVAPSDEPAPRVFEVLRPDEPLATLQLDLAIPVARQTGDKTNCGPTTAAMTLAAFRGEDDPRRARELRDLVGEWTWQAFPLRQMRAPGYDAGMTTREMMRQSLDAFGRSADVRFTVLDHPWLPLESWSLLAMKRALAERRPVVVLAEAATLWDLPRATGLHWVVVRGFSGGSVIMNDPADGAVTAVPLERFWTAWRLSDLYRSLPMVAGFEALVADRSLPIRPAAFTPMSIAAPDALPPRVY
ncbi:MAG: C39 family peptidase [Deltaproteobacteria bacterium]|nr:C39 family peptidase [Deltaproteobacteria bacterium]